MVQIGKLYSRKTVIGQSDGTMYTLYGPVAVKVDWMETQVFLFGFRVRYRHEPLRVTSDGRSVMGIDEFEIVN